MNPLTNVKNINKINEREAELGISSKSSWHQQYSDSAYIFIGGLPYDLTEGDIICVFSQYGEIVNINLVRDKKSGKSKGYCFIAYEDQRSTILAVDNLNGIKLLGRVLRVDHVAEYRKPKEDDNDDEITQKLRQEGCAPRTPSPSPPPASDDELADSHTKDSKRSKKKSKKEKKKKKRKEKVSSDSSSSDSDAEERDRRKIKKEKKTFSENGKGHDDRRYNKKFDDASRNGDRSARYDGSAKKERDSESNRDRRPDREDRYRQDRHAERDRSDRSPHRSRDYEENERYRERDRQREYRDRSSDSREDRHRADRHDRDKDRRGRDRR